MPARKNALTVTLGMMLLGVVANGQTRTAVGMVRTTGPEERSVVMPGVRLTLTCGNEPARTIVSDREGQFQFANVPVGTCVVATDIQGFKPVTGWISGAAAAQIDLSLSLDREALYTGLTVTNASVDRARSCCTHQQRRCGRTGAATAGTVCGW